MKMSKTSAIRESSKLVSVNGRGLTSWVVVGPSRASEPSGSYTEQQYTSYTKALRGAASWKACIACALMGIFTEDTMYLIDRAAHEDGIANTHALVAIGIKAQVQA